MKTDILIPAKSGLNGKTRLRHVLNVPNRQGLIHAMLTDILAAIAQSQFDLNRVWVVSADQDLKAIAATYKVNYLYDPMTTLNSSLDQAIRTLDVSPDHDLLILPSDIPLIQPDDLDQLRHLVQISTKPVVFLTPSLTGGTNLLYQSPSNLITPTFGPNSFKRHRDLAVQQGSQQQLYSAPTIRLDIDTQSDLQQFIAHPLSPTTHTYQFL